MRLGMRNPSIKKMVSARTTGRAKRTIKSQINPYYGKKGVGLMKSPKRSVKGMVYKRTTFSLWDLFK